MLENVPPAARLPLAQQIATHRELLLRRARWLSPSPSDAEDLVQATLERALTRLGSFHDGTNLPAWLSRIMSNLFLDGRRRHRGREVSFTDVEIEEAPPLEPEVPPPWEVLTAEDVVRAVERLPPHLRVVFDLHLQGLAYEEIGARLELSVKTVGTRLFRARRALRGLLAPSGAPGGAAPGSGADREPDSKPTLADRCRRRLASAWQASAPAPHAAAAA